LPRVHPVKLATSVKTAAARLAKADCVSLNQFVAAAGAEEVGVMQTARELLERRAAKAKPRDAAPLLPTAAPSGRPKRTIDRR
jgi:hypothetical protein